MKYTLNEQKKMTDEPNEQVYDRVDTVFDSDTGILAPC